MIKLGVVGTGGMANSHAKAFSAIPGVKLVACCDIDAARARSFGEKWNIPGVHTDYRRMFAVEKLDAVTNVTIDAAHAPVSTAAIKRGLDVLCEKPLGVTLAEARRMRDLAVRKKVVHMVNFSYRRSSGLQAAAKYVRDGGIGRVLHVESSYLQSWLSQPAWGDWRTKAAFTWRLSTKHGSGGVLGDVGCHILDMTAFLCGDIRSIFCDLKTFDKGVRGNRLGEYVLDANDSCVMTVEFANGAIGTVHTTRWATGQMNSLRTRVWGDQGAVEVDLDRSYDEYRVVRGKKAMLAAEWKTVACKPAPTMYQRFVRAVKSRRNDPSDFVNGAKVQAYLHCGFESARRGRPVKVVF
ncbi:MAG TPA: Gfo/Idh/MocA family oxidoreductase [Planctomycetota bacterium]|nr:Gfo/Idh/MocA family oxidoreductase [Planctomycetota bacterium]